MIVIFIVIIIINILVTIVVIILPLWNSGMCGRSPPGGKHDEGVVHPDAQQQEGGGQVQRDELHLDCDCHHHDLTDEDVGNILDFHL